jgi:ribose/xylose/arabinose/galactoside ABC-type transport system permease subunit
MTTETIALSRLKTARKRFSFKLNQELILLFALLLLTLVTTSINERFLRTGNVSDILGNSSFAAVAAIGMSMVIISGNIDISVGSLIGVLATISGKLAVELAEQGQPIWIAFLAPILVGMVIEGFNGFLVAYLRIPAMVVTLGMMSILQGGLILWTSGRWIYDLPSDFMLAQKELVGIPAPVYFMVVLTILAALWMRYSDTGRAIYAVGGNAEAARLVGISRERVIMTVFILHGCMVGIASVLWATQFTTIQSTVPPGLLMFIISASVIGGVSILGGVGTVVGSTLGAILLRTINSAMIFADISQYWLQAVQGSLILLTVLVDLYRRKRQTYIGD